MDVTSLSLLLVAAIVGMVTIEAVIRRTDVGAGIVLGLIVLQESSLFGELAFRGPVTVYPRDLVFVVMASAAIARLLRIERLTAAQRLLIGLALLVVWSVIRGVAAFGVPSALNESRGFLFVVATALYFATVEPRRDIYDRIGRIFLWAAAALCAITLLRWGANGVGITGGLFGEGGTMRVIPADTTLIVGQAAILKVTALRDPNGGLHRFAAPVLLAFVVLLQHRSVWVVVAVGAGYLLFRERALTPRLLGALCAGLIVLAGLSLTVMGDSGEVTEQLSESATSTGTWEWRVAGWRALLTQSEPSVSDTMLGRPFGSGWDRQLDGQLVDVSPHNYYISSYLRVGIVGLVLLLSLYAFALKHRRNLSEPMDLGGLFSRNVLLTLVGAQLLYYIPYGADAPQAMILGLGCAAASVAEWQRNHLVERS